jgi:diguanylate cyclase (GGDEF)-like protein
MTDRPIVLVADDSAVVRGAVRSQLVEQGFEMIEAGDGQRALDAVRECRPHVVLLDLEMPVMDGLQVLRAIKQDPEVADTPVVFLAAREGTSDLVEALEMGAHDYLRKPFDPSELLARVRAAHRVKSLQDELRQRNAELDLVSRTDALTGLWNRRHLAQQILGAESLARRHGTGVSAVMVDIDHFKRINDTAGHAAGDRVLQEVAARLRTSIRTEDLLSRWGGEEFLVILPFAGADGAASLAERIRQAISAEPMSGGHRTVRITVSVGFATLAEGEGRPWWPARTLRSTKPSEPGATASWPLRRTDPPDERANQLDVLPGLTD